MKYLTIKEIAAVAKLSEESIRRMVRDNKLIGEKTSNKQGYTIALDELLNKGIVTQENVDSLINGQTQAADIINDSEIYAWRGLLQTDIDGMDSADVLTKKLYCEFNLLEKKKGDLLTSLSKKQREIAQLKWLVDCLKHESDEILNHIEKVRELHKN